MAAIRPTVGAVVAVWGASGEGVVRSNKNVRHLGARFPPIWLPFGPLWVQWRPFGVKLIGVKSVGVKSVGVMTLVCIRLV